MCGWVCGCDMHVSVSVCRGVGGDIHVCVSVCESECVCVSV